MLRQDQKAEHSQAGACQYRTPRPGRAQLALQYMMGIGAAFIAVVPFASVVPNDLCVC